MASNTHRQAVAQIVAEYNELTTTGGYIANNVPLHSLPFCLCFGFLILPARFNGIRLRSAVALSVVASALYNIIFTRARDASLAGGVGILNAYIIMWTIAHIALVDAKNEYARIKWFEDKTTKGNGMTTTAPQYRWQGFPASLRERFDWVVDLFISFEGMGWQWGISSLPPPPMRVQNSLLSSQRQGGLGFVTGHIQKRWRRQAGRSFRLSTNESEAVLLRRRWKQFAYGYLALDIIKTLLSIDPYFYGQINASPPSYLPHSLRQPYVVKAVRLLLAEQSVYLAIRTLLLIPDIYFLYNHTPQSIGIRGEAWMFPLAFGDFRSILDEGLVGFWSSYWHQTFRYIFAAPTNTLLKGLEIPSRSNQGQVIRICIAFFCSGIMHASISYTAVGTTYPIRGPMMFFLLQPVGILMQLGFITFVKRKNIHSYTPIWLRQFLNLFWCLTFGYLTAPLLIDDLVRGGQFLFEPVPFSIWRGIGLGNPDDGFICWHGPWYKWHWNGWSSGFIP